MEMKRDSEKEIQMKRGSEREMEMEARWSLKDRSVIRGTSVGCTVA